MKATFRFGDCIFNVVDCGITHEFTLSTFSCNVACEKPCDNLRWYPWTVPWSCWAFPYWGNGNIFKTYWDAQWMLVFSLLKFRSIHFPLFCSVLTPITCLWETTLTVVIILLKLLRYEEYISRLPFLCQYSFSLSSTTTLKC